MLVVIPAAIESSLVYYYLWYSIAHATALIKCHVERQHGLKIVEQERREKR
jgi:hypothetical protein